MPGVTVAYATIGAPAQTGSGDGFVTAASTQLLLFTFLTSLTGATALIETRRYGVSRRMYATPMAIGRILLGEAAGRVAVALGRARCR